MTTTDFYVDCIRRTAAEAIAHVGGDRFFRDRLNSAIEFGVTQLEAKAKSSDTLYDRVTELLEANNEKLFEARDLRQKLFAAKRRETALLQLIDNLMLELEGAAKPGG
jgi:hypothetical protein